MAKIGINIATGGLQQEEMIVGIDLGTTNSLVAIVHPESRKPVALREHDSASLVPSVLHFGDHGEITVGEAAREFLVTDPARTIFSVKRLMGKSYNDVRPNAARFTYQVIDDDAERLVKIKAGDKFYSPVELSAFILKELKKRAEHILKTPVNKVVITVPAYFNDAQRQATRDAGKLAGLDVLRIINEPTAASLAYGLGASKDQRKTIAVYDLGGGTFDISILNLDHGIFDVLATNGDTALGGDDLDDLLRDHLAVEAGLDPIEAAKDPALWQSLRLAAEQAKRSLSAADETEVIAGEKKIRVTRATFETLIRPLVDRTLDSCRQALRDAKLTTASIDEIVMVGGSTRVPLVKRAISEFFGKPVHDQLNPDEVVALGAAVQADILAGNNKDFLLLDITPLSLGIETMGGLMDVLIPRNSKIPSSVARQYTTQKDGQSGMRISVFQGERDLVRDNRKLAEFNLSGIPAMPAGLAKVEIGFLINADGILVVKAKELRSGVQQQVEVKPQYGLTDAELEQMLLDSITHAKSDMADRAKIEAATEARQLIDATEKFLTRHAGHLTGKEISDTRSAIADLEKSLAAGNRDFISGLSEKLNSVSRPYAERVMDLAVASAMKGKKI